MTNNPNTQTEVRSTPETPINSSTPIAPNNPQELGVFAAGGALAATGVAMGIGILPVAIAGTMLGAVAYGVKKTLFDSPTPADPNQPSFSNVVSATASQTVNTVSVLTGQTISWMSKKFKGSAATSSDNKVAQKI